MESRFFGAPEGSQLSEIGHLESKNVLGLASCVAPGFSAGLDRGMVAGLPCRWRSSALYLLSDRTLRIALHKLRQARCLLHATLDLCGRVLKPCGPIR